MQNAVITEDAQIMKNKRTDMNEIIKNKVLSELNNIAVDAEVIFNSSQRIQKGIGVYPISKKLRSTTPRFEDIKLKVKKEHQGEYLTANATAKIQWRAEYIVLTIAKIIELLQSGEGDEAEHASLPESLAEQIKYFKTQHPIHLV